MPLSNSGRSSASSEIDWDGALWPVLEHYGWELPGPRSGWVTVKCGAHKDSHASCRVNNTLGAAKCQACDFHGDIINIIRFYEGKDLDFRSALRIAEAITGTSHGHVRSQRDGGIRVSSEPRDRAADRAYVPPRLRSAG